MNHLKKIKRIYNSRPQSVGDGFVGKNAISANHYEDFSPFLMLDHHGPMQVKPSDVPKGVDEHPHRGIETITLVFEGALQHRDSAGNKGTLLEGDIQWMSAASGIVHEEKHELGFSKRGGILNFIQLWTNLPSRYKMTPPRYQEISASQIPQVKISENTNIRVFAGDFAGVSGTAKTYSPIILAEIKTTGKDYFRLSVPQGYNLGVYTIDGTLTVNEQSKLSAGLAASFEREGDEIILSTESPIHALLLGGEPIQEPVVAYGPFVMNTQAEIRQAIADYQMGKMGHLD
jgi:redox-sensitive bicupin YhaK (pirin superfamily)